jgi:hypothetical protein
VSRRFGKWRQWEFGDNIDLPENSRQSSLIRCQGVDTHIGIIGDAAGDAESDGTGRVLLYWFRESLGAVDKIESISLRGHLKRINEFMSREVMEWMQGVVGQRERRRRGGRNEVRI